jgi:hypothetical protein
MPLTDRQRIKEMKRFPKWKELKEAYGEYKKNIANSVNKKIVK